MREVINISLPKELNLIVEKMVKKDRYSTKSEFVRDLIRERIEEEDLSGQIKKKRSRISSWKGQGFAFLERFALNYI
ncbi:MAG: ribbon-helix-helix domain-containing protein [Candidatus Nealsonbacteria bacterium]